MLKTAPWLRTPIKRIAFYTSSHGYGHASRSAVLLKKLAPNYDIQVKTEIPGEFFSGYLGDSVSWIPQKVDVGCVQKNYVDIDAEQTFAQYRKFLTNSAERLHKETGWLLKNRIDLVVCDIASFPLKSARMAGLPGVLVANFTWYDIYSGLPGAGKHTDLLDVLREEYSSATVHFLPQFALENDLRAPKKIVGFMSLKGRRRREELERSLPVKGKTLVFIYLGLYDISFIQWKNLERLTDCAFITRDPHSDPPSNLHVLDDSFSYADLMASADVVVSKAGYSTLASAFHHGKPVVACDRNEFCEAEKISEFILQNDIGVVVQPEPFNACDWENAIKQAKGLSVKDKVRLRGEDVVAEEIGKLLEP